jgi:hypothetical protein
MEIRPGTHGRGSASKNTPLLLGISRVNCRSATSLPFQLAHCRVQNRALRPGEVGQVAQATAGERGPEHAGPLGVGHNTTEPAPTKMQNPVVAVALPRQRGANPFRFVGVVKISIARF